MEFKLPGYGNNIEYFKVMIALPNLKFRISSRPLQLRTGNHVTWGTSIQKFKKKFTLMFLFCLGKFRRNAEQ